MPSKTTVHILLATYNGARYLAEQLESIGRQTHSAWTLTVSDDGSTDDTLSILQSFAAQVTQPITVLRGPRKGSATSNFYYLVEQALTDNVQDLFAFCDQDDIWHNEKLQRAVQWHLQHNNKNVRLFCGRTQFVNNQLRPIGLSPSIKRQPSFGNALVQNIASGNTMVFSHSVLAALKKVQPAHYVWHDWTTYLVTTALRGEVWFDHEPCLLYRQHETNVVGSNNNLSQLLKSIKLSLHGRYQSRLSLNLLAVSDLQIQANAFVCEHTCVIPFIRESKNPLRRFILLHRSNIRRQGALSNVGLFIAGLIGKL